MVRAISSSLMSLLMVLTLVWGGCISCPQFFMFPKLVDKSCCNSSGQCERRSSQEPVKECTKMPIEAQDFVSAHTELAIATLGTEPVVVGPTLVAIFPVPDEIRDTAEHPPPDLIVLHSTFVI